MVGESVHPCDRFLQERAVPSMWCSGCGIGTIVNTFVQAIEKLQIDPKEISVVAGVGCTGKVVEYIRFGSLHEQVDRIITYAVNLKRENPEQKVVVFQNNADLLISGGADIMAAEKDVGICIIHVNNVIYTVSQHGAVPVTPFVRYTENKDFELPFNVPYFAKVSEAKYIARWTPLHVRRIIHSISTALQSQMFSLIEIISPCAIFDANDDQFSQIVDHMRFCHDHCTVDPKTPFADLDIRISKKIIMGTFLS